MAKKRKRRPGGGRKPGGEFPGKYAAFTTRLQPETRRALDEAAARSKYGSVSATAEFILKQGLKKPSGEPRNLALACAVALLAERIERATGQSWRQDKFTGWALRYAVEALLFHLAPTAEGEPAATPAVEKSAEKMPPEFAERFRRPAGLGHTLAFNMILELEQARSTAMPNEWSLPVFFSEEPAQLGLISRDLELADTKKGKSK
jgi:hypothetical protein